MKLVLVIDGVVKEFDQDIIKVGSLPSSHLRINDPKVSRMHAVIEVDRQDVYIVDLGSESGTIIRGKKIMKGKLSEGDRIVLGSTIVHVQQIGEVARVAGYREASKKPEPTASALLEALRSQTSTGFKEMARLCYEIAEAAEQSDSKIVDLMERYKVQSEASAAYAVALFQATLVGKTL